MIRALNIPSSAWVAGALVGALLFAPVGCRPPRDRTASGPHAPAPPRDGPRPAETLTRGPIALGGASGDHPNLLIITIDTLRMDHLGCYGYFRDTSPNIDNLAAESLLFVGCHAPVAQTLPSHTSLFTGVYPREHGVVANLSQTAGLYAPSPRLQTLATALSGAGYHTAAVVSAEPVKRDTGLEIGFEFFSEPKDKKVFSDDATRRAIDWLACGPPEPFFLWVHYFDPHARYEPPAPFDKMFQTDDRLERYLSDQGFEDEASKRANGGVKVKQTRQDINLYDGEIRYTDREIGRLIEAFHQSGLGDDLVLVLTADHGEGLGQHGLPAHGNIWGEQLRVPLILRIPGEPPQRIERPLNTPDIIPTLAALAPALPLEVFLSQATGVNRLSPSGAERPLYAQLPGSRNTMAEAILLGGWRLIRDPKNGDRLYNLTEDPYELRNLIASEPVRAATLRDRLAAWAAEQTERGRQNEAGKVIPMSTERKSALTDLGYVEEEEDHSGS